MGMQIWACRKKVKSHPRIIIWTNLVNLESKMLYTKIQPQSFLVLENKISKGLLVYMGMVPSCLMVWNPLNQLSISFQQKLVKISQALLQKTTL